MRAQMARHDRWADLSVAGTDGYVVGVDSMRLSAYFPARAICSLTRATTPAVPKMTSFMTRSQ